MSAKGAAGSGLEKVQRTAEHDERRIRVPVGSQRCEIRELQALDHPGDLELVGQRDPDDVRFDDWAERLERKEWSARLAMRCRVVRQKRPLRGHTQRAR